MEGSMEPQAQNWFDEDTALDDSTVQNFEEMCGELFHQRSTVKALEDRVSDEKKILEKMKSKILGYLDQFGKDKYQSEYGTVSRTKKFSVKVPKDEASKEKLFGWLKEKGIDMHYMTVNSISLNSLYKKELDAMGVDFEMPGVEEPTYYELLNVRSK